MLDIYQTPQDFLYLTLSVSVALLVIFLVIALYHLIRIMVDVRKVSAKAADTMDLINHYLWQPIKILMMILEKTRDFRSNMGGGKKKK